MQRMVSIRMTNKDIFIEKSPYCIYFLLFITANRTYLQYIKPKCVDSAIYLFTFCITPSSIKFFGGVQGYLFFKKGTPAKNIIIKLSAAL